MSAQSFLAKAGLRTATMGSLASLAFALPLIEGSYDPAAHTAASRTGLFGVTGTSLTTVVNGVAILTAGVASLTSSVIGVFPASTTAMASIQLTPGVDPTTPNDGEMWITGSGVFARVAGVTQQLDGGGGGTIGGSIAANQVAYGSGVNTIQGNAALTFDGTNLSTTGLYFGGDGSSGAPTFSFTSDPTTGIYLSGAGDLGFATGGVLALNMNATGFTSQVIGVFPASSLSAASIRLPHGTPPAGPIDGDLWTTIAGLFVEINGTVIGPLGVPGGATTQVQYNSAGTFAGVSQFSYDDSTFLLTLTTSAGAPGIYLSDGSNGIQLIGQGTGGGNTKFTVQSSNGLDGFSVSVNTSTSEVSLDAFGATSSISAAVPFRTLSGSAGSPGLWLAAAGTEGLGSYSAGKVNVTAGGLDIAEFTSASFTVDGEIHANFGLFSTFVKFTAQASEPVSGLSLWANSSDSNALYYNGVPLLAAAGSNTEIQFNNSGAFGASSALTFDGTDLATTGHIYTGDGIVGVPAYSFTSDTTTGVYSSGVGVLNLAAAGFDILSATATEVTIDGKLTVTGLIDPTGLQFDPVAANPGTAPTLWVNSGDSNKLYFGAGAVTSGGTPGGSDTQVQFNDSGSFGGDAGMTYDKTTDFLTLAGGAILAAGTAAAPSLQFAGVTNAGLFRGAGGNVAISSNGVQQAIFTATGVSIANSLTVSSGGAGSPTLRGGGASTGIAFTGSTGVGLVVSGSNILDATLTALTASVIGVFPASTTGSASIRLTPGVTPTSLTDGDLWVTGAGLFGRISGVTVAYGSAAPAGSNTQIQFNNSGAFGGSANLTWDGTTFTSGGLSRLSGHTAVGNLAPKTTSLLFVHDNLVPVSSVVQGIEVVATTSGSSDGSLYGTIITAMSNHTGAGTSATVGVQAFAQVNSIGPTHTAIGGAFLAGNDLTVGITTDKIIGVDVSVATAGDGASSSYGSRVALSVAGENALTTANYGAKYDITSGGFGGASSEDHFWGQQITFLIASSAAVTNYVDGVQIATSISPGAVIQNYTGFETTVDNGGTINGNHFGVVIGFTGTAPVGTLYGLYQTNADMNNYFEGRLGIGTLPSLDARLALGASTTDAASLRFDGGAGPSAPTDGSMWFDGTDFKGQQGGLTKTFVLA